MPVSIQSDSELLTTWLEHRQERAFHDLVERYAGLVHMAAMRRCGDDYLAAEVSQLTFIALANKARSLVCRDSVAGWLHVTAVMHSRNLLRQRNRESKKLQRYRTEMEKESQFQTSDQWLRMKPVLDEALTALSANDREALLLRFYRSMSIREIAASLGIATDAAQKRLNRATERLRLQLSRRGCQTETSLAAIMMARLGADAKVSIPAASRYASKAMAISAIDGGGTGTAFVIMQLGKHSSLTAGIVVVLVGVISAGFMIHNSSTTRSNTSHENFRMPERLVLTGNTADQESALIDKSHPHKNSAVKYSELASKYGESRTNFSKHVVGGIIELFDNILEMGEKVTEARFSETLASPGGALSATLGKLEEKLKLTDEQRKRAVELLSEHQKARVAKARIAVERMKKNPSTLMRLLLASDACARKQMSETEYLELQNEVGPELEGLMNPFDQSYQNMEEIPDVSGYLTDLKKLLDETQLQTLQSYLNEQSTEDLHPARSKGISRMEPMELEKIDSVIRAMKQMTSGLRGVMEGVGGLEDLRLPQEHP